MPRGLLPLAAALFGAVALGSCATLNKAECVTGDWMSIGRRDGGQGEPMARVADHAKACAKHGVSPDPRAYAIGRDEGLRSYCTGPSGFLHGRYDDAYHGVCPGVLEPEFLAGYRDGSAVASVLNRVRQLEDRRQGRRNRANEIERQIDNEQKALDAAKTPEEAKALREKIRGLRTERQKALNDADAAEDDMEDARRAADEARRRYTPIYGPF